MAAGFRDITSAVRGILNATGVTVDKATMRKVGELAVKIIQRRTRLGYSSFPYAGSKVKLMALAPRPGAPSDYVGFRRKNKSLLDSTTSPKKSNLTFTGQMLRSLGVNAVSFGKVIVGPTGRRNRDLARWHEQGAGNLPKRQFLGLREVERRQLLRLVENELTKNLKRKGF